MPMRLQTALTLASDFGFTLPTRRMVDAIYVQAAVHLAPQPLPASDHMRSVNYLVQHNDLVREQRVSLQWLPGVSSAGDKKDIVLTNRLREHPDRVAIYGWHTLDGKPIQPLSTVHGWRYADYSHGVRLVSARVWVDGQARAIYDVLGDSVLAQALSDEGAIEDMPSLIEFLSKRNTAPASVASSSPPIL
jgi:hypothetical protein